MNNLPRLVGNAKRIGRFRIDFVDIELYPRTVTAFMQTLELLIVRAESNYAYKAIEYMAYSQKFDLVDPGLTVPLYEIDLALSTVTKL